MMDKSKGQGANSDAPAERVQGLDEAMAQELARTHAAREELARLSLTRELALLREALGSFAKDEPDTESRDLALREIRMENAQVRIVLVPYLHETLVDAAIRTVENYCAVGRAVGIAQGGGTVEQAARALRERNEALQIEACEQHTTLLELQEVLSDTSVDERELEGAELVQAARALALKCSGLILEIGQARYVLDAPSHETLLDAAKRAVASNPPLA